MRVPEPSAAKLRIVRRDIRAMARDFHCRAVTGFSGRNGHFAARIAERYAPQRCASRILEMTLRRLWRHPGQTFVNSHTALHVTPLITVNVAASRPVHLTTARIERQMQTEHLRFVSHERHLARTLVERMVERETRYERDGKIIDVRQTSAPGESGSVRTHARRVPPIFPAGGWPDRIFRRSSPTVNVESSEAGAHQIRNLGTASIAAAERQKAPSRRAEPVSPIEIQRITDHVLTTIDRRIIASRERRGEV